MTNSYFALLDYAMTRGLGLNIDQGTGLVTFRNKKTNEHIQLKADLDIKVTIEKVEDWLFGGERNE